MMTSSISATLVNKIAFSLHWEVYDGNSGSLLLDRIMAPGETQGVMLSPGTGARYGAVRYKLKENSIFTIEELISDGDKIYLN